MISHWTRRAKVKRGGKVEVVFSDLQEGDLVEVQVRRELEAGTTPGERIFGIMKGQVLWISDDFDAPLEEFRDYS